MCGIFGFSYIDKKKLINYSDVKKDIGLFTKLNKIRGSDTFGVSISSDKENFIYKVNTDPILAIQRKDYKLFLQQSLENLSKKDQNKICIIGQTRLVTNGTKFLYSNNQPIITKYITGVHNGIIINLKDEEQSKTPNLEGYGVKSDSLEFYENLSQIKEKKEKFFENYLNYLKNIVGNYSIAFKLLDSSKIIISSNCGSLYYFFDRDLKKFIFSDILIFFVFKIFILYLNFLRDLRFLFLSNTKVTKKFLYFNLWIPSKHLIKRLSIIIEGIIILNFNIDIPYDLTSA